MNGTIEVVMCKRDRLGRKLQSKVRCLSHNGVDVERFAVREILRGKKRHQSANAIDRFFGEGKYAKAAE